MDIQVGGADPARGHVGRKPERRKTRLGGCLPFWIGRIPVPFGEDCPFREARMKMRDRCGKRWGFSLVSRRISDDAFSRLR